MSTPDYVISVYRYFSRFVPKSVLTNDMKQVSGKRYAGYDEVKNEILTQPDDFVIADIGTFVVSSDIERVSDKLKNSTGVVLFVEHGKLSFDPTATVGIAQNLSVTVVENCEFSNNDNLNEALLVNKCNNILLTILNQMQADQTELEACGESSLIRFPANITPVERQTFYNRAGWAAFFDNTKSTL